MKYLAYILMLSSYMSCYGQESSIPQFYLQDPLLKSNGKFKIPSSYLKNISFKQDLQQIALMDTSGGRTKRNLGFIDKRGKFIVAPHYMEAESSSYGIIALRDEGKNWSFYKDGELIGEKEFFQDYKILSDQYILVSRDFKWGVYKLGKKQHTLVKPVYKKIELISGSTFKFTHFNTWTLKNRYNDSLHSYYCDTVRFIRHSFLLCQINNHNKAIDHDGNQAIGMMDSQIKVFEIPSDASVNAPDYEIFKMIERGKSLKKTAKPSKLALVDSSGREIVQYDSIKGPYEKTFVLYNEGRIAILNDKGIILSEYSNRFEKLFPFIEGRAKFVKSGKFGFIDQRGNVRIAPQYASARDFKEGLAAVIINDRWGFVDKDENIVVQPHYSKVYDFKNGIARAQSGGIWYFVNKKGERLDNAYDEIRELENEKWLLVRNNKLGLADKNANELLAPRYEYLEDLEKGMVLVKKSGRWGVVDYKENFVFPIKFDYVSYSKDQELFLFMEKGKEELIDMNEEALK